MIQCILFSRDNGISLQIQMYQLWSEVFVFVIYLFLAFFLSFFNRMNRMLIGKVSQLVIQFVVYVVQPLFYLHGEASFRNNCINQGISHALKKVLFDHYTLFHINNTIAPRQNMSWNETVLAEYTETLYFTKILLETTILTLISK